MTGVEDDKAQAARRFDRPQHAVKRDGLVLDIEIARQHRIEREVIGAVDLNAVSGKVDDRDVGVAQRLGEIADGAPHLHQVDVAARLDDREAGGPQQDGYRRPIVHRIGEPADMLVVRVPNYQRDALLRKTRHDPNHRDPQDARNYRRAAHGACLPCGRECRKPNPTAGRFKGRRSNRPPQLASNRFGGPPTRRWMRFLISGFVTHMYGPAVRRKRFLRSADCGLASMYPASLWSGLCSEPLWISARVRSH